MFHNALYVGILVYLLLFLIVITSECTVYIVRYSYLKGTIAGFDGE